jgi:hypothetical protein
MQLNRWIFTGALVLLAWPASAQSLSPMHKTGTTPSDIKGFKLQVANPYDRKMTFVVVPMDPQFVNEAEKARVLPNEVRLAPGAGRAVTLQFKIDTNAKERTIGVCVMPKDLEGPLLPRVCGTYTGRIIGPGGKSG